MRAGAISPSAAATPPKRATWWIVPAVLIGSVVLVWLYLTRMPFGGSEAPAAPKVETIAEGTASGPSATIVEVTPDDDFDETSTPALAEPNIATQTEPAATPPAEPPGVTTTTQQPARVPRPATPRTASPTVTRPQTPPSASTEITASEAESLLRSYVTSRNYYRIDGECLRINNRGYRNVGYTLEVWDRCQASGASRLLGSWRVDSKTREVFLRRDDGRYLRP